MVTGPIVSNSNPYICVREGGKRRRRHRLCSINQQNLRRRRADGEILFFKKKLSHLNSLQIKHCKAKLFHIMHGLGQYYYQNSKDIFARCQARSPTQFERAYPLLSELY